MQLMRGRLRLLSIWFPKASPLLCSDHATLKERIILYVGALVNSVAPRSRGTGVGYGSTPLMRAYGCKDKERLEIVTFLLKNGADVNALDEFGDSALSLFASTEDIKSMAVLLDYGADPSVTGHDKSNALSVAIIRNNKSMGTLLLQYGATWDNLSPEINYVLPDWVRPFPVPRKPSKKAGQPDAPSAPSKAPTPPPKAPPSTSPRAPQSPPAAGRGARAASAHFVPPPPPGAEEGLEEEPLPAHSTVPAHVAPLVSILVSSMEIISNSRDDRDAITDLLRSNAVFVAQLKKLARVC